MRLTLRYLGAVLLTSVLVACSGEHVADSPTVRLKVAAAPVEVVVEPEPEVTAEPISAAAQEKIAEIRAIIARNSLARFVRLADAEPSFVSNFSDQSNRVHWDLLRRTGFDPLTQLEALLDGPYGTRQVGDATWYIWPDLAAWEPADLVPEKLSFADRARLRDLVGEQGLERIREGQFYPGIRTAIADDGRWLYFIHETEDEAVETE